MHSRCQGAGTQGAFAFSRQKDANESFLPTRSSCLQRFRGGRRIRLRHQPHGFAFLKRVRRCRSSRNALSILRWAKTGSCSTTLINAPSPAIGFRECGRWRKNTIFHSKRFISPTKRLPACARAGHHVCAVLRRTIPPQGIQSDKSSHWPACNVLNLPPTGGIFPSRRQLAYRLFQRVGVLGLGRRVIR